MIRRATHCDIAALRRLWTEVFNDSSLFLDRFFSSLFEPENCLFIEQNGQVASMLFLLKATASCPGGNCPLYYVYACATHPGFREKGLMGQLLNEAVKYADEKGINLILIPANEPLFHYYKHFGFTHETALYCCSYSPMKRAKTALGWERVDVSDITRATAVLQELRTMFLGKKNAVLWPDAHIEVVLEELQTQGGELLLLRSVGSQYQGYALTRSRNGRVEVIECASAGSQKEMVASLRCHYNEYETFFTLSSPTQLCTRIPYGLLYTPNSDTQPLYLNLGLE